MTLQAVLENDVHPAEEGVSAVIEGRLVRFDEARGYGFITPRQGGGDVFMHANEFLSERDLLKIGVLVEYQVTHGDRGLRATAVRALEATHTDLAHTSTPVRRAAVDEQTRAALAESVDDELCDALVTDQYLREVTDVIIAAVPSMTGQQIIDLRERMCEFSRGHGWIID
jgi:CspA family cold shock protein